MTDTERAVACAVLAAMFLVTREGLLVLLALTAGFQVFRAAADSRGRPDEPAALRCAGRRLVADVCHSRRRLNRARHGRLRALIHLSRSLAARHASQRPARRTLARLKPLLPRMGITRLANVTGLDTIGIPVVMSVRPNSRSLSVSQGKGLDLDAAKVTAAMESIEGFHAEYPSGPLRLASYDELRAEHLVADPLRLPLSDDHHFRPSLPMLWMAGHDWIRDEQVYIPFQLVHTAYTTRMRWDLIGFAASSTGLASGNHLLEAVSHALCEVIERDATAEFLAMPIEQQQSRQVDTATVDHPDCIALLERFRESGIAAAIWDLTSRVGLPVFSA